MAVVGSNSSTALRSGAALECRIFSPARVHVMLGLRKDLLSDASKRRRFAANSVPAKGGIYSAWLAQGGCFPDPEPDASRSPGTDFAGLKESSSKSPDPYRCGHDETRRHGVLREGEVLSGAPSQVSERYGHARIVTSSHAHGRAQGGSLARHHSKKLRV